jgi:hypothetical protein
MNCHQHLVEGSCLGHCCFDSGYYNRYLVCECFMKSIFFYSEIDMPFCLLTANLESLTDPRLVCILLFLEYLFSWDLGHLFSSQKSPSLWPAVKLGDHLSLMYFSVIHWRSFNSLTSGDLSNKPSVHLCLVRKDRKLQIHIPGSSKGTWEWDCSLDTCWHCKVTRRHTDGTVEVILQIGSKELTWKEWQNRRTDRAWG